MAGFTWLSLLLAALLLGFVLLKRVRFLYALRNIPSPRALPLIGNALQLNCNLEDFFAKLVRWSKEFGDIYLLWVGSRPFIFIYRAEAVKTLLSSNLHIDKSLEYQYLKPWLGNGLIISAGEKWHFRRKLLTPTFHSELLKDYFQVANKEAQLFVSCLSTEIGNPAFDILPYAKRAALDVICECTMGYRINAQTDRKNEYVTAVQSLTSIAQMRFTNIWISCDAIFKRTSLGKEHDRALRTIHNFVDKIIAERKKERNTKRRTRRESESKAAGSESRKARCLLDLLLEMSDGDERDEQVQLSDEDIREEVNTFMFAGHDTVGTSVAWILYALGRHPEYQEKIVEELNELERAGRSGEEELLDSLQKPVWLDACIKEAWRLYPVTPLIARQIYTPITLQKNEIPSGSTVLINSYLLHRDPRHFPEPESFRPERFLPGNNARWPSFAYIPFSAGSRNCIGAKFATMEIKLTLAALLRAYRFRAIEPQARLRLVSQLVLDNVGGIRLAILPR